MFYYDKTNLDINK